MHEHGSHGSWRFSWVGVFLLIIGVWWLLGELGRVTFEWRFVGPMALILLAISMLLGRRRWHGYREWRERPPQNPPM